MPVLDQLHAGHFRHAAHEEERGSTMPAVTAITMSKTTVRK